MASDYISIGIALAVLSGISLLTFAINIILRNSKKRPLYYQKLPQKEHPAAFLQAVEIAYNTTGDIKGMLLLLQSSWSKGITGKRVLTALDYLENSRYRDYETTLFYLSDQSESCESVLKSVLEKEIRKQKALVCKN